MGQALLVSVIITARDEASAILRALGISGAGALAPLQIGAAGVLAGIAAIGAVSLVAATEFDQNMQKIAALTTTSGEQMQWYKQQILDMAPMLDQSPTALAQGLYFVISAGYSAGQAIDILRLSAQAAAATMTPMKDVSDLLTTSMNSYRGSNLSAGHAMDDLIKIVVNGKVTMSSLGTSFGFVAVQASVAKLSFDETSAAVSTLSQVAGEHGSRRVMMDLSNTIRSVVIQQDAVAGRAKKMGLAFDASKYASMSFIEKLQYLAQISGGVGYNLNWVRIKADLASGNMADLNLQTAHANASFLKLVGGAAAFIPAAMLLSDKGKEYNVILKQMGGNGQATADAFNTMRQSVGQQWNMFKVTLETIATVLGENLLPAASALLLPLVAAGHAFIAFGQSAHGVEQMKWALLGVALVATAILLPSIIGVVVASAPLTVSFLAIIAGGILLGAGLRALVQHFGGVSGVLRRVHPLIVFLQNALSAAGKELRKAFADSGAMGALKQLQAALPQILPFLKVIGIILAVVVVVAFQLLMLAVKAVIAALPGFIMMFQGVIEVLGGIGRLIIDIFTGKWKDILPALKQIGTGLLHIIGGALLAVWGVIHSVFDTIIGYFGLKDKDVRKWWSGLWTWVVNALGGFFGGIGRGIAGFFAAIGATLTNWGHGIMAFLGAVGHGIINAITYPFRMIAQAGQWLYQHNYFVQRFVDTVHRGLLRMRAIVMAVMAYVRATIAQRLAEVAAIAHAAMTLFHDHVVKPVEAAAAWVSAKITWLRGQVAKGWTIMVADATKGWQLFVKGIQEVANGISSAIQTYVINPIVKPIEKLIAQALQWGGNLMKMFAQGITNGVHAVEDAAKSGAHAAMKWLGFHSPSKGMPESAHWGANLIKMFAGSVTSALPSLQKAMGGVAGVIASGMTGAGGPGLGVGGPGSSASALLAVGSGGGNSQVTQHISAHFPNATNSREIEAAFTRMANQRERANNRQARAGGSYGGGAHW